MALDADLLVDRKRLKRQLTAWRIAAVVLAVAAVVIAVERFDLSRRDHVARLAIEGVITPDRSRGDALSDLVDDERAKALLVLIDSPGGTVVGGEDLFAQLRAVAEKKPVVAVMGDLATSAAYMTAIACDRIIARDGTLTGSIGVILQTADATQLFERLGVKPETIKSGPLKAQPNPFEPFTPDAREATRRVVMDVYDSFTAMVSERRGLSREAIAPLAAGQVFTGRQALASGLIDEIGGEPEARAWLAEARGVSKDLPVLDVDIAEDEPVGSGWIRTLLGRSLIPERLSLDGLVSVWHPAP